MTLSELVLRRFDGLFTKDIPQQDCVKERITLLHEFSTIFEAPELREGFHTSQLPHPPPHLEGELGVKQSACRILVGAMNVKLGTRKCVKKVYT